MRRFLLGIAAIAAVLAASPAHAQQSERGVFTALIENDLFGGTDRNYTNGVKFAYVAPWKRNDRLRAKLIDMFWPGEPDLILRSTYGVGHSMFTPDDITLTTPIAGQRPYAGWLYGFYGFIAEKPDSRVVTNIEIELGIVGQNAGAKWVQVHFHQLIDGQEPRGWDNQLKDEPGISVSVERAIRLAAPPAENGIGIDLAPDFGVVVGNVRTEAFTGATLRIGTDLERTALPLRVRPSLAGSGSFDTTRGWSWSAFFGVYGRAVARNIFLDGNTFKDSLSVPKKVFVADAQAGVALRLGPIQLSYTYVLRGEEYKGQNGNSRFGAVGVAWHF
jgi:hypothetical protein